MTKLLYNIFLLLYGLSIRIYSLADSKAKKWLSGRQNWQAKYKAALPPGEKRIWIHCSSLGEYEQGRPLIEALREQYPQYKIVLTFFSPSGYEACKKTTAVDHILYLPMDSKCNAQLFISIVNPALAIFVKYEFWHYYLHCLKAKNIPILLVSAAFRPGQSFFKWYGGFFRRMLRCFTCLFVQDESSKSLLAGIGLTGNVIVAGDTRYDRVAAIAGKIKRFPLVETFAAGHNILIAGSTWPDDEALLKDCLPSLPANWKLIIAPHEIDDAHIQKIRKQFDEPVLYSTLNGTNNTGKVLVIDNIGMLSSLYIYGTIAYIGGGFQKGGIHNILEPAVFGLPVIFGPVYEKFVEARRLVALKYAFPVRDSAQARNVLEKLVNDDNYRNRLHNELQTFMRHSIGATATITAAIANEGWL